MRGFYLVRDVDVSGVSGTGKIAQGVQFDDGTCAMRWLTGTASTAIYSSIDDLVIIHGHNGASKVEWIGWQSTEPINSNDRSHKYSGEQVPND